MNSKIEFLDGEEHGSTEHFDEDRVVPLHESEAQAASGAGARLRQARESKGVDLSHIAAETRIPIRHLESIEAGQYESLPSRIYAIGFAKNYARAVGLDREEIADLVRAELADNDQTRRREVGKMEPGDPAKLPSRGLAWVGAIAALILAIGVVAFYRTYFGVGSGPPPIAEETRSETAPAGASEGEQVGERLAVASPDGPVVFTAMEDDVWVRFYEPGGERLFEATMAEGDTFEIPAGADEPLINTGRPHLLAIEIDGQDVPKLSEEQTTLSDVPVSAEALLARDEAPEVTEVTGTTGN